MSYTFNKLIFYSKNILFLVEPIQFIKTYVTLLSESLSEHGHKLTKIQQTNMAIILSVIMIYNRICWKDIETATMGQNTAKSTWWFIYKSGVPFDKLFLASTQMLLKLYGITEGILGVDETDNPRSKKTPFIHKTHKYFEKKSGGYKNGQEIVILVLITSTITIPVGFAFYEPDQAIGDWRKQNKKLIKQNIPKSKRPKCPKPSENYRSKTQLAAELVKDFKRFNSMIKIKAVIADALYGSNSFFKSMSNVSDQLISQLKTNQKVTYKNKSYTVKDFFTTVFKPLESTIKIRGDYDQKVMFRAIRVHVNAHGCKRFVIAINYPAAELRGIDAYIKVN